MTDFKSLSVCLYVKQAFLVHHCPLVGAFSVIVKTLPMVSLQLYSWPACERNISKYARKGQHLFSAEEGKGQNGKTLNLLHCIVTVCVNSRKYLIGWKNPAVAPQKVHHKIRPLQSCILKSRMRILCIISSFSVPSSSYYVKFSLNFLWKFIEGSLKQI